MFIYTDLQTILCHSKSQLYCKSTFSNGTTQRVNWYFTWLQHFQDLGTKLLEHNKVRYEDEEAEDHITAV